MRNPWLSLYLSAANQLTGAARSQFMAEAARQQAAGMKAATDQLIAFWTGGLIAPPPKRKRRPRRRVG